MSHATDDVHHLRAALEEAAKGEGLTAPNPPVGAVVVRDGRVIGRGWHRKAGTPHAEREALGDCVENGHDPRGATVYVTLEPCSTRGRTPPCTEALVEAGVARVVYGTADPDPRHRGRAEAVLREADIDVTTGVEEEACRHLLRGFASAVERGRPWVIAKVAQSLDGRIVRPPGEGPWLTGEEARADVQALRARVDALLTSGETLRRDDPALTLRVPHPHGPKPPLPRIIITRGGALPATSKVFTDACARSTLVASLGMRARPDDLPPPVGFACFPDMPALLTHLAGELGIHTLMVEAGGRLLGTLLDGGWVDEWVGYFAPLLVGGGALAGGGAGAGEAQRAPRLRDARWSRHGPDLRLRGCLKYPVDKPARALRPAVFVDRDGVINDPGDHYYVKRPEDFHLMPGAIDLLAAARAAGHVLVCITNQRGVGKGEMTAGKLDAVHARMQELLEAPGCAFDAVHAYTGLESNGPGAKPDPLFILQATRDLGLDLGRSWMIGDADRDILAGKRAGLRTIRVRGDKPVETAADVTVDSVAEAARLFGG